jgi:hypothetical protein
MALGDVKSYGVSLTGIVLPVASLESSSSSTRSSDFLLKRKIASEVV